MRNSDKPPIVCGTDFSATATEAINIAAAMARRLASRLVLVHADQFYRSSLVSDPTVVETAISERRGELNSEAQRLRDLGTQVEEKSLFGSAFDELVATATKSKARFIVVGAIGRGLARRLLLGSIAERTAETSPVPTLVVRMKRADLDMKDRCHWQLIRRRFKRILRAT